jgi:hypothetical protein
VKLRYIVDDRAMGFALPNATAVNVVAVPVPALSNRRRLH